MDDFESRLDHELAGLARVPLAEPEPVEHLRRRARRVRVGRAVAGITALSTVAIVVAAVVVVGRNQSPTLRHPSRSLRVAAPSFVLGDIDAVVLSSNFDADGARASFSPAVAATVAHVPGVQSVSGVVDNFAPLARENNLVPINADLPRGTPPRTPILFSYHQDDEMHLLSGRLPITPDEIVVDADFILRNQAAVGDVESFQRGPSNLQPPRDLRIVGTFDLPGVDLAGIPLAAMSAAHQSPQLPLDRLDVKLAPSADPANVRDAIATAVGNDFTVAQPSVISFPDQRVAQLEIQHAYWALLSPDPTERSTAVAAPPNPNGNVAYQEHASETANAELRVENVTFLSPDAATLTYRVFYDGQPSPVVKAPQSGAATRVDGVWKLTKDTVCNLAAADHLDCSGFSTASPPPPSGFQPPSTLEPEVTHAFTTLADPATTVEQRVGAVWAGADSRPEIAAGIAVDKVYASETTFSVLGWRADGSAKIDVLYTLVTKTGPSTPWPSVATAELAADGHWYVSDQYACGITGLTRGSCTSVTATSATAPVATSP